ncbi:hypothetical protein VTI74DRAFT_776 [Chaetomium olivicolor]
MRGSLLKVERKVFKHVNTPRRVKSQAFSIRGSATPKTPRASIAARSPLASGSGSGQFSKRETPAPAAQQGFQFPGAGQSFVPLFPTQSPVTNNAQPLVGASGLPVTPSTNPFGPNPFTYTGGYWPGMSMVQDPTTGQAYYTYTPPTAPTTDTPTRGRGTGTTGTPCRHHQYFPGA